MNDKTLTALRASIVKWEKIVVGNGTDAGWHNCALCGLFWGGDCTGCPVAAATGRICCDETPYAAWLDHHTCAHSAFRPNKPFFAVVAGCAQCRTLAHAELDFLRGLLPPVAP